MNLKEAFRYQNRLQSLLTEAQDILDYDNNVVKVKITYLRNKVMPEAEDETIEETPPTEYSDRITKLVGFMLFLLDEKEKLYAAIRSAKNSAAIDIDSETSLNSSRQRIAKILTDMTQIRSSEQVIPNGGYGYRFNAEGNQTSYKCDVKKVTTINFDRNTVQRHVKQLMQKTDAVSADIDRCVVNTEITYEPPFDVNSPFSDVFDSYCALNQ